MKSTRSYPVSLFFILLLIGHAPCYADSKGGVDSLRTLLNSGIADTTRVNVMLNIAGYYNQRNNADTASHFIELALLKAQHIGYKKGEAKALKFKGKHELIFNNRYDKATLYLIRSLAIYDSIKDFEGAADCNLQLGIISYDLQSFNEAIFYFKKTLLHSNGINGLTATTNYLTALSYSELDSFSKALALFELALNEYKELGNTQGVLWCKEFTGKMYVNTGEYTKAISYLRGLTDDSEYTHDSVNLLPAFAFLSTAYLKVADYRNSIAYGSAAYRYGKQQMGSTYYIKEAVSSLHQSYKKTGDVGHAYFFLDLLNNLKDSIYSNNIIQGIGKIKSQYEYEQQLNLEKVEQEKRDLISRQELNKQKLLRNSSLLGFTVVLLFAGVFFRQRKKIEKAKKQSDDLLLNILPSEVAEELKLKGSADAKQFDHVSVMFTDFKNFTTISEKLTPAELVAEIDGCFIAFDHIITKYNIEKIKTIGDSYMCASGLPVPSKTHAVDIVNAALEIQQFMEDHIQKRKENNQEIFEIRIGIHSGPVVAGIVGIKKFAYDIWGDTVNIASRMESSGEPGKVNISGSCYELVKDKFTCTYRGMIQAKNKGEVDMYFVEGGAGTS